MGDWPLESYKIAKFQLQPRKDRKTQAKDGRLAFRSVVRFTMCLHDLFIIEKLILTRKYGKEGHQS